MINILCKICAIILLIITTNIDATAQYLVLKTDTSESVISLGKADTIEYTIDEFIIDTVKIEGDISMNKELVNKGIHIYNIRIEPYSSGKDSCLDINYVAKLYIYYDRNTIHFQGTNYFIIIDSVDLLKQAYVVINDSSKSDLAIYAQGTMVSINRKTHLSSWWLYGDCESFRIPYANGCGYSNFYFTSNGKLIIVEKQTSNIFSIGHLKQSYVLIDWETGNETTICKKCNIIDISKDEQFLIIQNKESNVDQMFGVYDINNNKVIKTFRGNSLNWAIKNR